MQPEQMIFCGFCKCDCMVDCKQAQVQIGLRSFAFRIGPGCPITVKHLLCFKCLHIAPTVSLQPKSMLPDSRTPNLAFAPLFALQCKCWAINLGSKPSDICYAADYCVVTTATRCPSRALTQQLNLAFSKMGCIAGYCVLTTAP